MDKPVENIKDEEYSFSKEEIESFLQTMQDFIDGKTTARNWEEIEQELNRRYPNS